MKNSLHLLLTAIISMTNGNTSASEDAVAAEFSPMPQAVVQSYIAYDNDVKTKVKYDMDIHSFNAATNLKDRLVVLRGNDSFSNAKLTFAQTRASLEGSPYYSEFANKASLKKNLDQLQTHLANNKVEARETATNIEELFSRVWSLGRSDADFAQQVLLSICDNSETGGGCYPGHAGRLGRLYVNFMRDQWL